MTITLTNELDSEEVLACRNTAWDCEADFPFVGN